MFDNITLRSYLADYPQAPDSAPWPRFILTTPEWRTLVERQLPSSDWQVLGLWAEKKTVFLMLRGSERHDIAIVSLDCPRAHYPAVSIARPAAWRLERMVADLHGLIAEKADDTRPWLDHGRWKCRHPLSSTPSPAADTPYTYGFLPTEGPSVHQIPVGPVHAGVIEPGHFRFSCSGETVVRLEERLGYVHKGIEALMAGKTPEQAARLAARISGDSTVAYSIAFARAIEAAMGWEIPVRAHTLRGVMAEWERIANHIGDFGAVCNDASFALMQNEASALRERILRTCKKCFGHRMMMDCVVPGGIRHDLTELQVDRLRALARMLKSKVEELSRLYDETSSLLDRTVGTGVVQAALARRFAAGGFVGRASSQATDARRAPGYPPYDGIDFPVPVYAEGDVNARLLVRLDEIRVSLGLIERLLGTLPEGAWREESPPPRSGEGMALIEGFRGEILIWVHLEENGRIARAHARDPSWFQWPLLEAAIENNIVADFPLCNKSFNCSYSGHDL